MLRLHTVRVGGHGYYVDDLPYGREAGTGLAGESPGRWMGDGAAALGLTERVAPEAFAHVLDGRDPLSGRALPVARNRVTVAGYDLVFCAPKSVSLLHALGPTELSSAVGEGHDAAVQATAEYVARAAFGVRRSDHGHRRTLPTTGMVGGAFVHRTSRALDPHLHTHVVAANVAQGVDGVWSAVDGRGLFAHMAAAGRLYHAQLRHELTGRLGVAWDVRPNGFGDVVGVDPGLRRLFSQRSADIKAYVFERSGRASARGAFYATRPEKDRTVSWEALVPEWRRARQRARLRDRCPQPGRRTGSRPEGVRRRAVAVGNCRAGAAGRHAVASRPRVGGGHRARGRWSGERRRGRGRPALRRGTGARWRWIRGQTLAGARHRRRGPIPRRRADPSVGAEASWSR